MRSKSSGGHKAAIAPEVRAEALKIRGRLVALMPLRRRWASRPARSAAGFVASISRSCGRRPEPGGGLEELKRIGQLMLARDRPAVEEPEVRNAFDGSEPAPEPGPADPPDTGKPRRRRFVFWGDEAAEVPEREPVPVPVSDA